MDNLVVVVGGSGFIGRYLVQGLAKRGDRIRVVARNPERAGFLKPLGGLGQIQLAQADVRSPKSLAAVMRGATQVVNLVGILAEGGGVTFDALQAEGAGNVAAAARDAGVGAFVQVSAIGADAASASGYGRSKADGEARVTAALPHATIVRPSVVFGPEDQFINRFAALAKSLPLTPVVAGDTRFQPVFVEDVAAAIAAALADPARYGGHIYELGGPRVVSMRELLGWINREIRVERRLVDVPDFVARIMAQAGDYLPAAPLTSDQWAMLQHDNVVGDGMAGLDAFGIQPTPIEAVAPAYLTRYRRGGRFNTDAPQQGSAAAL